METKKSKSETKKIEIEVPKGKTAKWIDGVLTLVDEEVKDTRPINERIRTFEDACRELGENHPFVLQYSTLRDGGANGVDCVDIAAYLKLRIICAALNEEWEPQFTKGEHRYYPYFYLYTMDEFDEMSKKDHSKLVLFGGTAYGGATAGFAYAYSNYGASNASANIGSRLCLKNSDLATYCGKQFIDIWADFCLIRNKDIEQ